jgi:DNA topoisomerase IB
MYSKRRFKPEPGIYLYTASRVTDILVSKVAARYKKKRLSEEGTAIYEYSERQISRRNNEKAERLETLRKNVHKVRAQVKKDLKSEDPDTVLKALAVGLMDHTAERVGNPQSAKDGHFGVTGWGKKHISFGKGKATVTYVGKSGVKQKKTVSDPGLLKALRKAYDACKDDIFCHEAGTVTASHVNAYLKKFEITAKDIRGLHANQKMQQKLKSLRKGELPTDPKERKEQLKKEFEQALEETAAEVGHEAKTLQNQYLVPSMEEEYMKGRVMTKLVKEAGIAARVASTYMMLQVRLKIAEAIEDEV